MYAFLWRLLPGPTPVKAIAAVALTLAVVALLMFAIFPAIEPHLPLDQVVIG